MIAASILILAIVVFVIGAVLANILNKISIGIDRLAAAGPANGGAQRRNGSTPACPDSVPLHALAARAQSEVQIAFAAERERRREVESAERAIRPYLGDLPMSCDSVDEVYRVALEGIEAVGRPN